MKYVIDVIPSAAAVTARTVTAHKLSGRTRSVIADREASESVASAVAQGEVQTQPGEKCSRHDVARLALQRAQTGRHRHSFAGRITVSPVRLSTFDPVAARTRF